MLRRFLALWRRPAPPATPPAEDWHPGDLAECVDGGGWWLIKNGQEEPGPATGQRFVVREVRVRRTSRGHRAVFLAFARWPGTGFQAVCFRKVRPVADAHEAAEPAFAQALRHRQREDAL